MTDHPGKGWIGMNYLAVHEGDYSPVELAWCAYVRKDEYEGILTILKSKKYI